MKGLSFLKVFITFAISSPPGNWPFEIKLVTQPVKRGHISLAIGCVTFINFEYSSMIFPRKTMEEIKGFIGCFFIHIIILGLQENVCKKISFK